MERRVGTILSKNRIGRSLVSEFTIGLGIGIAGLVGGALALDYFGDWDWDGVPNYVERKQGTNPYAANLNVYASKFLGIDDERLLNYFKRVDNTDEGRKVAIVAYKSIKKYGIEEAILEKLDEITLDHRISKEEVNEINDLDGDGLFQVKLNEGEITEAEVGSNPLLPNKVLAYAYEKGIDLKKVSPLLISLDMDGKLDNNDRNFVDLIAKYKQASNINAIITYLKQFVKDGELSRDELVKAEKTLYFGYRLVDFTGKEGLSYLNEEAAKLGLEVRVYEFKVSDASVKAIVYYAKAIEEGLPLMLEDVSLLITKTQSNYGNKLVNFKPIVFYSIDGKHFFVIPNEARDTWILARVLSILKERGMDVKPKEFEAFNVKILANNYSVFDARYGIGYMEMEVNGREVKLTDADLLQIYALQWELYKKASQGKYYNFDFPWWDSDKLEKLYSKENTRNQALFFFFNLPNTTFDMEKQERVFGIEGARISLEQAFREYKIISELYPDGKIKWPVHGVVPNDEVDPRFEYYCWLVDRGCIPENGPPRLCNTVEQFVGMDWETLHKLIWKDYNPWYPWDAIKDYDGIDQFLTKNWEYWDLVKFIVGYERWGNKGGTEGATEAYILLPTLRMFGFPTWTINIYPEPKGTGVWEWAVSLPDYVAKALIEKYGDKILIGPGNLVGLYITPKEGLIKDGIKEISTLNTYLMKRG